MAPRTLTDASRWLEANTPNLNPEAYARAKSEIDAAAGEARAAADQQVQALMADALAEGQEAMEALAEVRDNLAALAAEGELGRLTAKEYAARLTRLQAEQRRWENRLASLQDDADAVERMESDPVGYVDGLHQRYPLLPRPNFTF